MGGKRRCEEVVGRGDGAARAVLLHLTNAGSKAIAVDGESRSCQCLCAW